MSKLLESLQKDKALFEKRTGKSINESSTKANSTYKSKIEQWQNTGEKLIAKKIKEKYPKRIMPYTPSRLGQMQALLMKFSPIWHEEFIGSNRSDMDDLGNDRDDGEFGYSDEQSHDNNGNDDNVKFYDYVYSDGSIIRLGVHLDHPVYKNITVGPASIDWYFSNASLHAIYDKLVKLGLIKGKSINESGYKHPTAEQRQEINRFHEKMESMPGTLSKTIRGDLVQSGIAKPVEDREDYPFPEGLDRRPKGLFKADSEESVIKFLEKYKSQELIRARAAHDAYYGRQSLEIVYKDGTQVTIEDYDAIFVWVNKYTYFSCDHDIIDFLDKNPVFLKQK